MDQPTPCPDATLAASQPRSSTSTQPSPRRTGIENNATTAENLTLPRGSTVVDSLHAEKKESCHEFEPQEGSAPTNDTEPIPADRIQAFANIVREHRAAGAKVEIIKYYWRLRVAGSKEWVEWNGGHVGKPGADMKFFFPLNGAFDRFPDPSKEFADIVVACATWHNGQQVRASTFLELEQQQLLQEHGGSNGDAKRKRDDGPDGDDIVDPGENAPVPPAPPAVDQSMPPPAPQPAAATEGYQPPADVLALVQEMDGGWGVQDLTGDSVEFLGDRPAPTQQAITQMEEDEALARALQEGSFDQLQRDDGGANAPAAAAAPVPQRPPPTAATIEERLAAKAREAIPQEVLDLAKTFGDGWDLGYTYEGVNDQGLYAAPQNPAVAAPAVQPQPALDAVPPQAAPAEPTQVDPVAAPPAGGGGGGAPINAEPTITDSLQILHEDSGVLQYYECPLCQDEHNVNEEPSVVLPCCGQFVCKEMLVGHVQMKMQDNDLPVMCPLVPLKKCDGHLRQNFCQEILPEDAAKKFDQITQRVTMQKAGFVFCRYDDCPGVLDPQDMGVEDTISTAPHHFVCPLNTKHQYCLECDKPWHTDETCEQYKKRIAEMPTEEQDQEMNDKLINEMGWARCPKCKAPVERQTGCNAMRCTCGCHFCYLCGVDCGRDAHQHFNQKGPCYGKLWTNTELDRERPAPVPAHQQALNAAVGFINNLPVVGRRPRAKPAAKRGRKR